jgi:peptide/nickel transport system permease protein
VVSPDVSLGSLISQYQDSFATRPWLFWWPGLFIISIALCINFIGDGLRDAFDPRQRRRISKKDRAQAKLAAKVSA